jgi:hypothetical protein
MNIYPDNWKRNNMTENAKAAEKPMPDLGKFIENVNKRDKVSGLKLRLPVTRRKRRGR